MNRKLFRYISLFVALIFLAPGLQAKGKTFTVVIDAGHGGKDPGARGSIIDEKVINLSVALKLGNLIADNHDDINIIYTRKNDRFIELDERANIANRNKADLFISIHTNSVKKGSSVRGTETFTLGLARSQENLEVAMRENSAILLEDNYLQKYEGFDPNSSESYIIFEFMQNKHMEQSISLASEIQKSFRVNRRDDRGVKQGGLLVLRKTSMPSVLVELGFISNKDEERFMKSAEGQNQLAKSLYNAFSKYKREYDRKQGILNESSTNTESYSNRNNKEQVSEVEEKDDIEEKKETTTKTSVNSKKLIYKVQILSSDKKIPLNSKQFKGYKDITFYKENNTYKYTYGESNSFDTIKSIRRKVSKDFKDAFIVAFKDGKKVKY